MLVSMECAESSFQSAPKGPRLFKVLLKGLQRFPPCGGGASPLSGGGGIPPSAVVALLGLGGYTFPRGGAKIW